MLKVIALFLVFIICPSGLFAREVYNDAKCSKFLNTGWYKQYKYWGSALISTKVTGRAIRRDGFISSTSQYSTEATTWVTDPGTTTNRGESYPQLISSYGECAVWAFKKVKAERERYVAQNKEELKKETALGRGEYLAVLAYYSLCDESSLADFAQVLQKNYSKIFRSSDQNISTLVGNIDEAISSSPKLHRSCQIIL